MKPIRLLAVAALSAGLLAAGEARASLIEVTMDGLITNFDLPFGDLPAPWDNIAIGDSFTYVFVYDSTAMDTNPLPNVGDYPDAILGGEIRVGATMAATMGGWMLISNSSADWQTTEVMIDDEVLVETNLFDPTGLVLSSDKLPEFLELESFPPGLLRRFGIGDHSGTNLWLGEIMSLQYEIVPTPCPWDVEPMGGDGIVGVPDLLVLLAMWGTDPGGPPDFDGDGVVAVPDLLALLANWGLCQ